MNIDSSKIDWLALRVQQDEIAGIIHDQLDLGRFGHATLDKKQVQALEGVLNLLGALVDAHEREKK